ncbi:riboflavin synthase subunit alpha [Marinitoga sp. 1197]|uniref:riboflavin synthase n=1 Tax=unclassified Marinitoga TaxID=2640159 RepID=UPI000640E43B|nr:MULTISPECIES: riboflavin synthase [unclassified Marinitoga]KLO22016.1 riboflavin synthase subunit alpha [Marinitoga sp. 1197]KLO24621.1 riboflavin synthase subunit alpha [Marinitoga sp. 1155]NUU98849.1 riboflavin synthase subunit alpha [Marinitoga sp. 1154]
MFTGIIQQLAKIRIANKSVIIDNPFKDVQLGESIAINGVCLTVERIDNNKLYFSIGEETYIKTNLKYYNNKIVNLERALRLTDFLGGHIVTGHVDGIIKFLGIKKSSNTYWMKFKIPTEKWAIANKGAITINGISLTIAKKDLDSFEIQVIEHTYKNTNLRYLKINEFVNYEIDIIARYVKEIEI